MKKLTKRERKYHPEIEAAKEYIGYQNIRLYAKTDIPLTKKPFILTTPETVWEGYCADEKTVPQEISSSEGVSRYTFEAEERFTVEVKNFHPPYPSKRAVILLGDYGSVPQDEIAERLASEGFFVCAPDYCGVFPDTLTAFPNQYAYGKYGEGKEHLLRVCPTPQDTCNYLYAKIVRRTVTFLEEAFGLTHPVILAVKKSAEYAMQAVGVDDRILGLACICGCGYSEFLDTPRFSGEFLPIESTEWISGVSGITYLKRRPLPLFLGLGSNDLGSDVDRLAYIEDLVGKENFRVSIENGCADNIRTETFLTLLRWVRTLFLGATLPALPKADLVVNEEGTAYVNVYADTSASRKKVTVYYAVNTLNHSLRCWNAVSAETVGEGEYLAKLTLHHPSDRVFFYADVTYENGIVLSGCIETARTEGVVPIPKTNVSCLYAYGEKNVAFHEVDSSFAVLFREGVVCAATPSGIKGIVCATGKMIAFPSDITESVGNGKLLQVDSYAEASSYELRITVVDENLRCYTTLVGKESFSSFEPTRFRCSDFKDVCFQPLSSWQDVKVLIVENKNIYIGKVLFV